MGGTCLNIGFISSKAISHVADEFVKLRNFSKTSPIGIKADHPWVDLRTSVDWKGRIVELLTVQF